MRQSFGQDDAVKVPELEYAAKKNLTRRGRFPAEIKAITPWTELVTVQEQFYTKGEGSGRLPIGLVRMVRIYIVQQCLSSSDEVVQDAVYDSQATR